MDQAASDAKGLYTLSEREKGIARIPMLLRFALIGGATVAAMVLAGAAWERPRELADVPPAVEAETRPAAPAPRCGPATASFAPVVDHHAAGSRAACPGP